MLEDNSKTYNNIDKLCKKIIRYAQYEAEIELGVNPSDYSQADTGNLSEKDFEYIQRVEAIVEKKLKNFDWVDKTINFIKGDYNFLNSPIRGIKFDDELFRAGRGILEYYLKDHYEK